MAAQNDIRSAVFTKLHTGWNQATLPLVYDGHPEDVDKEADWGRATLLFAGRENAQIGTGMKRQTGSLIIQIFLRPETGTKKAYDVADALGVMFDDIKETITGGDIVYREVNLNRVGESGGYIQWNAKVAFKADIYA